MSPGHFCAVGVLNGLVDPHGWVGVPGPFAFGRERLNNWYEKVPPDILR